MKHWRTITRTAGALSLVMLLGVGTYVPGLHAQEGLFEEPQAESEGDEALDVAMVQGGSLLLAPGRWQIEPSLTYANIVSNNLNVIGLSIAGIPEVTLFAITQSEKIRRDILIPSLTIRRGLTQRTQADVRIPYRFQWQRNSTGDGTEETSSASDIGDIEASLSYQLMSESVGRPGLIFNVGAKSDTGKFTFEPGQVSTGTGGWSGRTGLLFVKTDDPMVFFGKIGYTYNGDVDVNSPTVNTLEPGDTVEFALGASVALSYRSALSFAVSQAFTFESKQDGRSLPNSQLSSATLKVGVTHSLTENMSMDLGVTAGLTDDAPDVTWDIRVPYTF
ncbi:MAG: transporter [Candidatus Omnitrophica bacterium]|nr:transporter [Candidatus Omnitrophota bacterium]